MQWCEQVDHFFANKQVQSRLAVLATRIMTRCPVQTSTKKYDKNLIKQAVTVIVKLQRLIEKHYNTTKNVFFLHSVLHLEIFAHNFFEDIVKLESAV